jgi:hypothetical protein
LKIARFINLEQETSYSIVITATNIGGSSSSTEVFVVRTLQSMPTQPTNLSISRLGATRFTVSWIGGDNATSYTYKLNNILTIPYFDDSIVNKTVTFNALNHSTSYDIIVAANIHNYKHSFTIIQNTKNQISMIQT